MAGASFDDPADLLARIDRSWDRLAALIGKANAAGQVDDDLGEGWSARQSAAHITAWERSLIALLSGTPRAEAMGIPDSMWMESATDAVNDAIALRASSASASDVLSSFETTHAELRALLAAMTPDDLGRPYSHFQPGEPPFNPTPVIEWINGNTWSHYDEHADALARAV